MNKTKKSIVTIGGGTGHYSLLSGLKHVKDCIITAIVSMADNGKSTGELRDQLGALPPGDILKALVALSQLPEETTRDILMTRFTVGSAFSGHNAGNLMLTLFHQYSGNFIDTINATGEILKIRGRVLPVTTANINLHAELEDGQIIHGETNIDIPKHNPDLHVKRVYLEPNGMALGSVISAIRDADHIIISPGDLWTSIIPVLLVNGVTTAIAQSRAQITIITNLMTKRGETNGYGVNEFVYGIETHMKKPCDNILFNSQHPTAETIKSYEEEGGHIVHRENLSEILRSKRRFIEKDLLEEKDGLVRHHRNKLRVAISEIIHNNVSP